MEYRVERLDLALGLLQQGASYGMVYLYVGIFMLLVTGFVATVLVSGAADLAGPEV